MGTWTITISGSGPHHNKDDHDADVLATNITKHMRDCGHFIDRAEFQLTVGDPENLLTASAPEDGEGEPAICDYCEQPGGVPQGSEGVIMHNVCWFEFLEQEGERDDLSGAFEEDAP